MSWERSDETYQTPHNVILNESEGSHKLLIPVLWICNPMMQRSRFNNPVSSFGSKALTLSYSGWNSHRDKHALAYFQKSSGFKLCFSTVPVFFLKLLLLVIFTH